MKSLLLCLNILFLAPAAFAQAAPAPSAAMQFIPIAFMLVVFYFLLIRPQMKRQKLHVAFLKALKRGDEVVTSSGIFGRITSLTEDRVELEIANGVVIKLLKTQIAASPNAVVEKKP